MKTPPIVSPPEWEEAREQLLVKEKELTRARDAMAAARRRMPWSAVEQEYAFDGPRGRGVGGLARGLPADPAVRVVELARRVPPRRGGPSRTGRARRLLPLTTRRSTAAEPLPRQAGG